jgi:nudix motif 8
LISAISFFSFPGGKRDEDDENLEQTALRECEEEINLRPLRILGTWHDLPNKDRTIAVTPVIAFMGDVDPRQFATSYNPAEVCL